MYRRGPSSRAPSGRALSRSPFRRRGPIGNLRAEIEAVQDGLLQPDGEAINSLHEEVLLLSRLVEDLHQLALSDAGALPLARAQVPAASLVSDAAERFRARFASVGVDLHVSVEPGLPVVLVDHQRVGQAVANLLSNALRYAPRGSAVWISGRMQMHAVLITVCDSGSGVNREEMPFLFDRFYRRKRSWPCHHSGDCHRAWRHKLEEVD